MTTCWYADPRGGDAPGVTRVVLDLTGDAERHHLAPSPPPTG